MKCMTAGRDRPGRILAMMLPEIFPAEGKDAFLTEEMPREAEKLLCRVLQREKEIRDFVPRKFSRAVLLFKGGWRADFLPPPDKPGSLISFGKTSLPKSLMVLHAGRRLERIPALLPFDTASLLEAASGELKLQPKEILAAAESLYLSGLITQPLTEKAALSDAGVSAIRAFAEANDLPVSPRFRRRKKEGTAEEGIRPLDIALEKGGKTPAEAALYAMIRLRALSSVMADAVASAVSVVLEGFAGGRRQVFKAEGKRIVSGGWALIDPLSAIPKENPVPLLKAGDFVTPAVTVITSGRTRPPSRLTVSELIRKEGLFPVIGLVGKGVLLETGDGLRPAGGYCGLKGVDAGLEMKGETNGKN